MFYGDRGYYYRVYYEVENYCFLWWGSCKIIRYLFNFVLFLVLLYYFVVD